MQHAAQQPVLAPRRTQRHDLHLLVRAERPLADESHSALFNALGSLDWYLEVATTRARRFALVGDASPASR